MSTEQWLVELWGAHQAFRSLGFLAQDLYVGFGNVINVGTDAVFLSLRTQDKEFVFTVARVPGASIDQIFADWTKFVNEIQSEANDERSRETWEASQLGRDLKLFGGLVATLAKRGFEIPSLPAELHAAAAKLGSEVPPPKPLGEA